MLRQTVLLLIWPARHSSRRDLACGLTLRHAEHSMPCWWKRHGASMTQCEPSVPGALLGPLGQVVVSRVRHQAGGQVRGPRHCALLKVVQQLCSHHMTKNSQRALEQQSL